MPLAPTGEIIQLLEKVEMHRMMQLSTGVLGATLVGSVYAFGMYANQMKTKFHLDQTQLTTVSTAGYMIALFNYPSGLAFDKLGPPFVNFVAGLLLGVGFLLLGLLFSGHFDGSVSTSDHATIVLSVVYAICCWPAGFCDIGTLMPNLFMFPKDQGNVIIIQKTFMGLGTGLFTAAFVGFFNSSDVAGYCFFFAVTAVVFAWICAATVRMPPKATVTSDQPAGVLNLWGTGTHSTVGRYISAAAAPQRPLHAGIALMTIILIYCTIVAALDGFGVLQSASISSNARIIIAAVAFTLLLLFPAVLMLTMRAVSFKHVSERLTQLYENHSFDSAVSLDFWHSEKSMKSDHNRDEDPKEEGEPVGDDRTTLLQQQEKTSDHSYGSETTTLQHQAPTRESQVNATDDRHTVAFTDTCRPYDNSIRQSVCFSLDFWLLWIVICIGLGTGAVISGNLAQIYRAIANVDDFTTNTTLAQKDTSSQAETDTAMFITIGAVGSSLGRIVAGVAQQRYSHVSVSLYLPVICVVQTVSMLLFAVMPTGTVGALAIPFFLHPAAYGATWAVAILSVRMMFPQDVGQHYGVIYFGGVVGIAALNRGIFGPWYDHQANAHGTFPHCLGTDCVAGPLIVLAAINGAAAVISWILHWRWMKRQYDKDID